MNSLSIVPPPPEPVNDIRVALVRDRVAEISSGIPGTIDSLVRQASRITGVDAELIRGTTRTADVCWVRYAIMLIARDERRSLTSIGHVLGGRDHSTVIKGIQRAKGLYEDDVAFAHLVDLLREYHAALPRPYGTGISEDDSAD